ncbi:MAG: HugZ family protein, partial [Alphaproteobacteria bacterium]|nr:HugZ family protein [Alphaproteobacteria bacterium]
TGPRAGLAARQPAAHDRRMGEGEARDEDREARALVRALGTASLATRRAEDGWPYASLVLAATDPAGRPVLLLSRLAEHRRNLEAEPRCALLFDGTAGLGERLAGSRITLLCRALPVDDRVCRARFLARHPGAASYVDFADFGFFRMEPERAHLVAGFGRIRWIEADALLVAAPAGLVSAEPSILAHMNDDHKDAIRLFATRLLGLPETEDWRMTGIDMEGCDIAGGARTGRLAFARPVTDAGKAREELVRLTRAARG